MMVEMKFVHQENLPDLWRSHAWNRIHTICNQIWAISSVWRKTWWW